MRVNAVHSNIGPIEPGQHLFEILVIDYFERTSAWYHTIVDHQWKCSRYPNQTLPAMYPGEAAGDELEGAKSIGDPPVQEEELLFHAWPWTCARAKSCIEAPRVFVVHLVEFESGVFH